MAHNGTYGLNVIMSDNTQSLLPLNYDKNYKETRMNPEGAIVKKVIMYGHSDSEIAGF